MNDIETGEVILTAPKGSLCISFKKDDEIHMVSFVGIPLEEMVLVYADEHQANFTFPFTEEEFASMEKKFGKYVVILNALELEHHVISYCNAVGCECILDKIKYCNQNRLDRIQAFNSSSKERFLYKNSDFLSTTISE